MKKILLLGLLFIGMNCFSQGTTQTQTWKGEPGDGNSDPKYPATTEKEYNYLTKGLKVQLEGGLDVINGYELIEEDKIIIENKYVFTFSNLIEKSTGDLKAISVVIKSGVSKTAYYSCIPINHVTYTLNYEKFLSSFTPDLAKAYLTALSQRYAKISLAVVNQNKKYK
jgi:hypothetical protein